MLAKKKNHYRHHRRYPSPPPRGVNHSCYAIQSETAGAAIPISNITAPRSECEGKREGCGPFFGVSDEAPTFSRIAAFAYPQFDHGVLFLRRAKRAEVKIDRDIAMFSIGKKEGGRDGEEKRAGEI